MCIRCVAKHVRDEIEDDYIGNRDSIIAGLYTYIGLNNKVTNEGKMFGKFNNAIKKYFNKLKDIQQMIEEGDDKTEVLIKLEILEVEMEFLQREEQLEMDRVMEAYR